MNYKTYRKTINLVESINAYREQQINEMIDEENEMCENYFRVNDIPNDKRGSF